MKHLEIMFSNVILNILLGAVILISSIPDAASYQKYGRTCQDIGCMRDEMCVIAEDPCSLYRRDNCGRYPTCVKARPGEANCASTVCGENEYCKTENGIPKCVKKSTAIVYPSRRPGRVKQTRPTPPPRTSSYGFGGRNNGNSRSRDPNGNDSIFNRLFGNDRNHGSYGVVNPTTPRSRIRPNANDYYNTHTSMDGQGNRIWTFSG